MKTVTTALRLALARNKGEATREVSYKRRYWDTAALAYVWEAAWTVVSRADVVAVSPVTEQLDSEQLNEFKVSNVTLTLLNTDNRWREDNPFGIFAQDSGSPGLQYDPYWTKFRVRVGIRLPDGSDEYVSLFSGVAVEYTSASNDQVQVTVQGLESLLMNANAEDVSTTVTEEYFAGPGTVFTTANPGVGVITEVSVAGIAVAGGDSTWSASDLDDPNLGATVTFQGSQSAVRITYKYWQQNKRIEELVRSLLTAAGIPSVDQLVSPVVFSNPILNAIVIDSMADWQAGTPTSIDYAAVPGSIKIDITDPANYSLLDSFTDGNFTANPVWTPQGNISWSVTGGGRLRYDKGGVTNMGVISTPVPPARIGLWKWTMNGVDSSFDKVTFGFNVMGFVQDTTNPFYQYSFNGNMLKITAPPYSGSSNQKWQLIVADQVIAQTDYNLPLLASGDVVIKVIAYGNHTFQVYVDSVLILQGYSPLYVVPNFFGIATEQGAFVLTDREVDDIYVPKAQFTATWVSPTYDMTAGVITIGKLFADYSTGLAETVTFETRTSPDGSTWDAWTSIDGAGQVQSTIRRYLQLRIVFGHNSSRYAEPIVNKVRIEYQTNVATITLAKFTGQTVYSAIQAFGQFSNYEWGFTADEDFFFRSKDTSRQADETVDRKDIQAISSLTTGYDKVYSEVRVTYGNFTAALKATGRPPRDSLSRFKSRILEVSVTDIVIGNDSDVATGVAKLFFNYFSRPRRRLRATCRFLPHVDLSDTLLVNFQQNRPKKTWTMGDETVSLGDQDASLWGAGEQLVSDMYAKVIGARHDTQRYASEFDLEEILP